MRTKKRGNKTMFITSKRIIQIFFLIPVLLLGLLVAPISYAENATKATYGPVKGSDTLGKIVSRNYAGSNLTQQQIMTGILRANPEAFIGGNIHFLLRGATLRLPTESLIATIDQQEAKKIIKEHYQYFRRGKTGNFKIEPLENSTTDNDTADFERDATAILAEDFKNNAPQQQDSQLPEIITPEIAKTEPVVGSNAQVKKAAPTRAGNTIKDIELESLKIKITQLEKILSRRGLSDSSSTSDEISKELKNTLKTQKEKIDLLEQERSSKNKELDQLQIKITELESSLKKMSQSLSDNKISSGTADAKDEIIAKLKQENKALEIKLSSLQTELDRKTEEVVSLTAEINLSKQKINELETKLLNSDQESAKLDRQIAEMEAKLAKIRQEPARNLGENEVNSTTSSLGMSPWVWLLPALFLLSILAYLFKRSFSQPKKALAIDEDIDTTDYHLQDTETTVVDEIDDEIYQQKDANRAEAIAAVPDIISSASEEESVEASIKLDIGKAYLDMDMSDAAIEILQEAYEEGSEKQRLEVQALLEKLA
jgi:FimV-like protein